MGRNTGKKYPEKISFLLSIQMREDINKVKIAKGFVVEVEAIRYLIKKGLKHYHKNKEVKT